METRTLGRQTILPPQPSRALSLFALLCALWFTLVEALYRIDGLARWARERSGPRPSPELARETDSEPRTRVMRAYGGTQLLGDASTRKTRPLDERITVGERNRA
jgi:hypothetical protein